MEGWGERLAGVQPGTSERGCPPAGQGVPPQLRAPPCQNPSCGTRQPGCWIPPQTRGRSCGGQPADLGACACCSCASPAACPAPPHEHTGAAKTLLATSAWEHCAASGPCGRQNSSLATAHACAAICIICKPWHGGKYCSGGAAGRVRSFRRLNPSAHGRVVGPAKPLRARAPLWQQVQHQGRVITPRLASYALRSSCLAQLGADQVQGRVERAPRSGVRSRRAL